MIAVPSRFDWKLTPFGNNPVAEREGVGEPVEVTKKSPGDPTVKDALPPLVNCGALSV